MSPGSSSSPAACQRRSTSACVCRENWVEAQEVKLKPQKRAKEKKAQPLIPTISLAGDARALRLSAGGKVLPTLDVDLALQRGKQPRPLSPSWDALRPPDLTSPGQGLLFNCKAQGRPVIRGWRLSVWELTQSGRRPLRRLSGMGDVPQQLLWDGTLAGKALLQRGRRYEAQLEITAEDGGGGSSPRRRFSVGLGRRIPPPPTSDPGASINEVPQQLSQRHRFTATVGRFPRRPLQVELRRGDGKRIWLTLGRPAPSPRREVAQVEIKGNLFAGKVQVNGHGVDTSLLSIGLSLASKDAELPALTPGGLLTSPAQFDPLLPPVLIKRWTLRISDAAGKRTRVLEGLGPVPRPIPWDGADTAGRGMIQPGGSYLALLTLEDTRGSVGRSPPLVIKAPGGADLAPVEIKGRRLFSAQSGDLLGRGRARLHRALRRIKARPGTERYRLQIQVAPPVAWEPQRWAGLLDQVKQKTITALVRWGLPHERLEITVGAAPLPGAPVVPKRGARKRRGGPAAPPRAQEIIILQAISPAPLVTATATPRVLVDGAPARVQDDGAFTTHTTATPGSMVVLELIDASDHRAQLLVQVRATAEGPSSRINSIAPARVASAGGDHGRR